MALAVHEALKLEALSRFKLVAGINGLDRNISRAGIIDHEEGKEVLDTALIGEFIITNFLIIRNQPERIVEYVGYLIDAQTACLAVKTIYFSEIPQEAIDLADEHGFPIFLFDETYIDTLVVEIDKALNIKGYQQRIITLVDQIIGTDLSEFRIRELAREINRNFKNNYIVYFARVSGVLEAEQVDYVSVSNIKSSLTERSLVLNYREGYLVIASYENKDSDRVEELGDISVRGLIGEYYRIGKSGVKNDLGELGTAINEAIYAYSYSDLYSLKESRFEEMGAYRVLMPLVDNPWACAFYKEIINKLLNYDKTNDSELLDTAIQYIECGADIQLTSKKLFQHPNTVRYRIRRIAKVIGFEDMKGNAYESLLIAIRLHLIRV